MKTSESITGIAPALIKAQGEMSGIAKEGNNPAFRSKYVTLDSILDTIRPVLTKHGLMLSQGITSQSVTEDKVTAIEVESRIIHASGEWVAQSVVVPITKHDAHGFGSALTYGRRYSVSSLLAISADEDDDGNAATNTLPRGPHGNIVIDAPIKPKGLQR